MLPSNNASRTASAELSCTCCCATFESSSHAAWLHSYDNVTVPSVQHAKCIAQTSSAMQTHLALFLVRAWQLLRSAFTYLASLSHGHLVSK